MRYNVIFYLLLSTFISESSLFSSQLYKQVDIPEQTDTLKSKKYNTIFTIRYGQGGFSDKRSDIDKLGGSQLTLDVAYEKFPVALSISEEYYTNSADPTHNYEISSLTSVNVLYMPWLSKERRSQIFLGAGTGFLEVPKSEDNPNETVNSMLFNMEAGINYQLFWKIGIYGLGKYLYAQKKVNGERFIDFNEFIILLGITINFSI